MKRTQVYEQQPTENDDNEEMKNENSELDQRANNNNNNNNNIWTQFKLYKVDSPCMNLHICLSWPIYRAKFIKAKKKYEKKNSGPVLILDH